MFSGQNGIGSSWGQPPQNQQPQPGTSAFGQPANPSTFGSGGGMPCFNRSHYAPLLTTSRAAFGSGGAFGQPQQPQQPQANPMFGGLGGTPSNTAAPASGFGSCALNQQVGRDI